MKECISVKNLTKTFTVYENTVTAVNDISFSLYPGEFVALTGSSGSGKSTVLNMIGLILQPTSGDILLNNSSILTVNDIKKCRMRNSYFGYVLQDFALLEDMSVYKNIELPLLYSDKKEICRKKDSRIHELCQMLGIEDKLKTKVKFLSGGQRQRVAIARALVNDPPVILADEPTGALDSKNSNEIFDIFRFLTKEKNKSVLVVTHELELVKYCTRSLQLSDGKLV